MHLDEKSRGNGCKGECGTDLARARVLDDAVAGHVLACGTTRADLGEGSGLDKTSSAGCGGSSLRRDVDSFRDDRGSGCCIAVRGGGGGYHNLRLDRGRSDVGGAYSSNGHGDSDSGC